MLPTVVLMPAFFLMLRAAGLQNTLTGLAVAYSSFTLPFTVWIMKSYFETIPRDLEGSGLVDGCTRLQVYRRIVLPMSGPGLVASGAFTFMLCWNELVIAQVLLSGPSSTRESQDRPPTEIHSRRPRPRRKRRARGRP